MYAVVKTGGKQYRVSPGDTIQVEKIEGEAGREVMLKEVLLVSGGTDLVVGKPFVQGVQVKAEIADQSRGRKVIIYKYRRRKRYHRKAGHRQELTTLRIKGIEAPGLTASDPNV